MQKTFLGWKFLKRDPHTGNMVSGYNRTTVWKTGKWNSVAGEVVHCHNGFHCVPAKIPSERITTYGICGNYPILALVEYREPHVATRTINRDKICARYMRIVKTFVVPKKAQRSIETLDSWLRSR